MVQVLQKQDTTVISKVNMSSNNYLQLSMFCIDSEGAAAALIRHIYERLTKRRALTTLHHEEEPINETQTDLSCADQAYQVRMIAEPIN